MENALYYLSIVIQFFVLIFLLLFWRSKSQEKDLLKQLEYMEKKQEKIENILREEMSRNREEINNNLKQGREESGNYINIMNDSLLNRINENIRLQNEQMDAFSGKLSNLTQSNEQKMDNVRNTIEERLKYLQEDNNKKLEQMRHIVDEKLQSTLEKRLGESFKLVSERLEMVHKGLGDMQHLASGVGDLKKVLTNVKTRGIWGELQLGNILEQVLAPDQYRANVVIKKGSNERVEYAIVLPGRGDDGEEVLLPIDAKFPQEDYYRLVEASESGNINEANEAAKNMENRIKLEAKSICEKYLDPPHTTDFAIMFLPSESLYAEVLRRPGLIEELQRKYRINISGPTTMAAFINSLSLGFRTLAIEKRSSEVWSLLAVVKTEFTNFGDILGKVQKKLQEASNTIDTATRKTRTIERKLRNVQELPSSDNVKILESDIGDAINEEDLFIE